jgi:hypothetical protein
MQALIRLNNGKAVIPWFLEALTEALGEPIGLDALLPLPETDAALISFRNAYQDAVKQALASLQTFFSAGQEESVLRFSECIATQLPSERAILIMKLSATCGAVRTEMATLLRHVSAIIRLDGDSLSALSEDGTQGLLVDYNADDERQTHEVTVWGERWLAAALACKLV